MNYAIAAVLLALLVLLTVVSYVDRLYTEIGKFLSREFQDNIDNFEQKVEPRLAHKWQYDLGNRGSIGKRHNGLTRTTKLIIECLNKCKLMSGIVNRRKFIRVLCDVAHPLRELLPD